MHGYHQEGTYSYASPMHVFIIYEFIHYLLELEAVYLISCIGIKLPTSNYYI